MHYKAQDSTPETLRRRTAAALGKTKAEVVIKNAQVLDVFGGGFHAGDIAMCDGIVVGTGEEYEAETTVDGSGLFAVPGFIDSHVHIESSLMTPARFQETVLPNGTTTALWDPHEIANVHGAEGIRWALSCLDALLLDVYLLLPSCVPATHLETSGAKLLASDLAPFASHPRVLGLAEVMNYPGVIHGDKDVWDKLSAFSKSIRDGHAPKLGGKELNCYLCAGIQACHESTTLSEAREKLQKGMHVLIREGSCAKDAHELLPLVNAFSSATIALCSDDRNPLDIAAEGHIDFIVNLGLQKGISAEAMFRVASFASARAYGFFDRGVIAPGYLADVCLVEQKAKGEWAQGFKVKRVFKRGKEVDASALKRFAEREKGTNRPAVTKPNINLKTVQKSDLKIVSSGSKTRETCRVIGVLPNQIVTEHLSRDLPVKNGEVQMEVAQDVLKIAVFERHFATGNHTVGFVTGFQLRSGAIAASIGHDSHNIVVVGASEDAMFAAIEQIRKQDGGIAVTSNDGTCVASLTLSIGGLMTDEAPEFVAQKVKELKKAAADLGCKLHEPFLQMSFLALPVIPSLKITDRGLVDVDKFEFVPLT